MTLGTLIRLLAGMNLDGDEFDRQAPLDGLTSRPEMYFRKNPDGYLREVGAVNFGFGVASGWNPETRRYNREIVPEAFLDFLREQLEPEPEEKIYWENLLVRHAGSEAAGWILFVECWKKYRDRDPSSL